MDKAVILQHDDYVRLPTQVDKAVVSAQQLLEERIAADVADIRGQIERHCAEMSEKVLGISNQFLERDTPTREPAPIYVSLGLSSSNMVLTPLPISGATAMPS